MKRNSNPTIADVAKLAGVSTATVSRVLNGKPSVSSETREKIKKVMNDLGFPQTKSISLNGGTILLCISNLANPFNISVSEGVQRTAMQKGYEVLLIQSPNDITFYSEYERLSRSHQFIGIIFLAPVRNLHLIEAIHQQCPVVMCSEYLHSNEISYVSTDDYLAAKIAINHLISSGRHKVALINGSSEKKYSQNRERGFREAMYEANLEINESWVLHIPAINYSLAINYVERLFHQTEFPDAIFAISDIFASAAIHVIKKRGLKVPQDIAVIGFDNTDISLMTEPSITTIQQPAHDIGDQSCELLIEKIHNPNADAKHILLGTELILREST